MTTFMAWLTSFLGVELTLGTDTYTLGGIVLGVTLVGIGIGFFKSMKKGR